MKKKYVKNLFNCLSWLGVVIIFQGILFGILLFLPDSEFRIKLDVFVLMAGLFILYFAISFFWFFQIVSFDDYGIHITFFKKTIRSVAWKNVESIVTSNRFRNPEIKVLVKDEKPLYLDQRKPIVALLRCYLDSKTSGAL